MLIKIILLLVLISILVWAIIKLVMLNRSPALKKPRTHREPTFSPTAPPSIEDENLLENEIEDSDAILGLNPKARVAEPSVPTAIKENAAGEVRNAQTAKPVSVPINTVAIHMMAPKTKPYIGYELLQALLAAGLRYGEKQIFHRHEHKSGKGAVLFHLASANAPGTFELAKMGGFSCPGLSFFMVLNNKIDNALAFETLLDTANQLAEDLGGELWDESYKPLTMDKITEYRIRVRDYNEATKMPDFFDQVQEV
jgi:cell division protein ZipA